MPLQFRLFVCLAACLWFVGSTSAADQPLPRTKIVKAGKGATALVEIRPRYGSAFCVHPSGLFVTNEHVLRQFNSPTTATLVLDAGLKTQKTLTAKVVRRDAALDLALLRVDGEHKLAALTLGSDQDLDELAELVAFGFPFGVALGKEGAYPAISVTTGRVNSLRRDKNGDLYRIQLDAVLNPGNSGGPVLDKDGKVVGVVVSGIPGAGINMAIPVSHLQRFLARPEIVFTPPVVNRGNQHEPAEFRAKALALLPDTAALELELILHTGAGKERRFAMKPSGGSYLAEAVPVPELAGPQAFPVEVKYNDGSVKGMVEERNFRVGGETISLSQVRKLLPAVNASVQLHDGRTISGTVTDLDPILVRIGKQSFRLDLARAVQISVDSADHASGIYCTILARHAGREVGRFHAPLNVDGAQRPSLAVGSDGLKIEDKLTTDDPKDRSLQFSPHKVYQVRLKAGQKYTIDLVSTDFDAFLRLEDASEKELARDDDSGGGLNARIIFTAPATASYRIIATCLNRRPGNFTLSVRTD